MLITQFLSKTCLNAAISIIYNLVDVIVLLYYELYIGVDYAVTYL